MSPKVSICIPAYNQVEYLRRTLASIDAQSFQDFEVVVSDDSSDNLVADLVAQFAGKFKLKYFKQKTPLGSPENWNFAVEKSEGHYIKIMHHDDWFVNSNSLGEFVGMLDRNPDAGLAFSGVIIHDASVSKRRLHFATKRQIALLNVEPTCLFYGNFLGPPSATIIRRSAYTAYDKNLVWTVDLAQYIEIISNNKFVATQRSLIFNAVGESSQITHRCEKNRIINIYEYMYLYDKYRNIFPAGGQRYLAHLISLMYLFGIKSELDIRNTGYAASIPIEVSAALEKSRFERQWVLARSKIAGKINAFERKIESFRFSTKYLTKGFSKDGAD